MALSQEVLKILIVALADRQAGEELFNAINNSLPISARTLEILIICMANELAAKGLARAIENKVPMSERILTILIVAMADRRAGLAIENQLEFNQIISDLTGVELYSSCNDAYMACFAQYEEDPEFNITACNNAAWAQLEPNYVIANQPNEASCSDLSGTPSDWFCGMDPIRGFGKVENVQMYPGFVATDNVGTECYCYVETFHSQSRLTIELGKLVVGHYTRIPVDITGVMNNYAFARGMVWDSVINKFILITNLGVISISTSGVVADESADLSLLPNLINGSTGPKFSGKGGGRYYIWDDGGSNAGVRCFNVATQEFLTAPQIAGPHGYSASFEITLEGNVIKSQNGSVQIVDPTIESPADSGEALQILSFATGASDAIGASIYLSGPNRIVASMFNGNYKVFSSVGALITTIVNPFTGTFQDNTFQDERIMMLNATDYIIYRVLNNPGMQVQIRKYSNATFIAAQSYTNNTQTSRRAYVFNTGANYIAENGIAIVTTPSVNPLLLNPATLALGPYTYDTFHVRITKSSEYNYNDCTGGPHLTDFTEYLYNNGEEFWNACYECFGDIDCYNFVAAFPQSPQSHHPSCTGSPGSGSVGDWKCACSGGDCDPSAPQQFADCEVIS